jgi:hypothetical protein
MEIQTKRSWKQRIWIGIKVAYNVFLILFVLILADWNTRLEDQQLTMYQDIAILDHNQATLQKELDILDQALGDLVQSKVEGKTKL